MGCIQPLLVSSALLLLQDVRHDRRLCHGTKPGADEGPED